MKSDIDELLFWICGEGLRNDRFVESIVSQGSADLFEGLTQFGLSKTGSSGQLAGAH